MNRKLVLVLKVLLSLALLFQTAPTGAMNALSVLTIEEKDSVEDIREALQSLINNESGTGGSLIVTGSKSDADEMLHLDIREKVTVLWQAKYSAKADNLHLISLSGFGTFEVSEGGTVINEYGTAITANFTDSNVKVKITDGKVSSATIDDDEAVNAIFVAAGELIITGGEVSISIGENAENSYSAIRVSSGDVTMTGGKISATVEGSGGGVTGVSVETGNVSITGGIIKATGGNEAWLSGINVNEGMIKIIEGTIEAVGGNDAFSSAIAIGTGAIKVTGGKIIASGGDDSDYAAIDMWDVGVAVILKGTCTGYFIVSDEDNGLIVEADSLNVPASYHGRNSGLTRIDDEVGDNSTFKWNIVDDKAIIVFSLGNGTTISLDWGTLFNDKSSGCNTTVGSMMAILLLLIIILHQVRYEKLINNVVRYIQ
jgi:hypothetical protein